MIKTAFGILKVSRRFLLTRPIFAQTLFIGAAHGQAQGACLGREHQLIKKQFRHSQNCGARIDTALLLLERFFGVFRLAGQLAITGQTQLAPHTQHPHCRQYHLRRLLWIATVLTQEQQDIDVIAGAELPSCSAHFVNHHPQCALIRANHAGQRATHFKTLLAQPGACTQAAPRGAPHRLINGSQAASRCGTEFFQGQIIGRQGHIRGDITDQYHHRLAGFVFNCRYTLLYRLSHRNFGNRLLSTQYQPPVTGGNCPDKQNGGQYQTASIVHAQTPFITAHCRLKNPFTIRQL